MVETKDMPVYGMLTNSNKFFEKMKQGDMFQYSEIFSLNSMKTRAERRGIVIELVHAGNRIVRVVRNRLKDKQIFHFNEEFIDI